MQKTHLQKNQEVNIRVSRNTVNWCVVASSAPAWAKKIFPDMPEAEAEEKLWQAIFESTRVTAPDPVAAWQEHIKHLRKRADYLQLKKYSALRYKSENTDFTLGLPRGHKWVSAQSLAENGVAFTANMPTEKIFTLPDSNRAEGTVFATFPLSYGGSLIEDFSVTFENGRIVRVKAKKNEAILQKLVNTDEGSTRLGEVALVPASSPIATRGILVEDNGPGIPDINRAMQEGFSTATPEMREMRFGAGMGLPNIRRNADHFEITSVVGKGTKLDIVIQMS